MPKGSSTDSLSSVHAHCPHHATCLPSESWRLGPGVGSSPGGDVQSQRASRPVIPGQANRAPSRDAAPSEGRFPPPRIRNSTSSIGRLVRRKRKDALHEVSPIRDSASLRLDRDKRRGDLQFITMSMSRATRHFPFRTGLDTGPDNPIIQRQCMREHRVTMASN